MIHRPIHFQIDKIISNLGARYVIIQDYFIWRILYLVLNLQMLWIHIFLESCL